MSYLIPLVIFSLAFAVVAWRDFSLALAIMVFLLPSYLVRFHLGPIPSTALEIMIDTLALVWLLQLLKRKDLKSSFLKVIRSLFFLPGLLLVVAAGLTIFWATDQMGALGIWKAYFAEPFILYCLAVDSLRTRRDWQRIFFALGALVIVLAVFAFFQRLTGWWSPTWQWTQPGQRRATGFFTSPNALGLLVAPISALYFGWFFLKTEIRERYQSFQILVLFSGFLGIALAVSRGAMIALASSVLLTFYLLGQKKKLLAGIILLLVLTLAIPQVRQLASFQNDSGQSRLALYEGSWELIKQNPIKGTGLDSFYENFNLVRPESFTEDLIYPHNIFLNFWLETGLLGLVAIIWIIFLVGKMAWQSKRLNWSWLFILALLPMFVHGLVDVPYFKNDLSVLTWLLLAGLTWSSAKENVILSETNYAKKEFTPAGN